MDISSRESFWEIYGRAIKEALELTGLFSRFIGSGSLPAGLPRMIGDISYSTGIDCNSPDKLIHFNSIFEAKNHS
jgi:hypothetical protein